MKEEKATTGAERDAEGKERRVGAAGAEERGGREEEGEGRRRR